MRAPTLMKWRVLIALAAAELLGLTLWFSATAITPTLVIEWKLDEGLASWLTMSVQLGFVFGTLFSALFNLPDILNARYLFATCALLGAIANGLIGLFVEEIHLALLLRFLTGFFLAGVYPPGMKIMATWFKRDRGMAIGVLVGALTLGSATPHLLKLFGELDWRLLMLSASLCSLAASLICLFLVRNGPFATVGARFDWRAIGRALTDPGVRLANFGYLGHQWELYAVWTWISLFLYESFSASGLANPGASAALASFATIGIGGLGCVVAGLLADRVGRTTVTIVSLAISGGCCLGVGLLFAGDPRLLLGLCLVWVFFCRRRLSTILHQHHRTIRPGLCGHDIDPADLSWFFINFDHHSLSTLLGRRTWMALGFCPARLGPGTRHSRYVPPTTLARRR